MTNDHRRGAVLTPQEAALLTPITDTDYLITILRYKRFFGAVITEVIPLALDRQEPKAPVSRAPASQIDIAFEKVAH